MIRCITEIDSICERCGLDFDADREMAVLIDRRKTSPGPIESVVTVRLYILEIEACF